MNIESVAFNDTVDHKKRSVTVKYFLSDPTNGNAAYDLITSDCTFVDTAGACLPAGTRPISPTKFGNLRFYLGYQNMIGQSDTTTEFSAGFSASAYAHTGQNDGSNHYTVSIPVPDDSAIAFAKGTARVVSTGQIVEPKLAAISAADPRPVVPGKFVNTVAQHTFKDLILSGPLQPRRVIVSNDKCNVCHGALGTTSGSNTADSAFHDGGRNTIEACAVCHDANRMSSSSIMTNGSSFNESYQFKRMIHGIHGNSRRTSPFTHNNKVVGIFCNPAGTTKTRRGHLCFYISGSCTRCIELCRRSRLPKCWPELQRLPRQRLLQAGLGHLGLRYQERRWRHRPQSLESHLAQGGNVHCLPRLCKGH